MIIDDLPSLAAPTGTDELPVERGTTTYKATLASLLDGADTRFKRFNIEANASKTLTFPAESCMGVIFTSGAGATKRAILIFGTDSSGNVDATQVIAGTHISFSYNGRVLTITNGGASYAFGDLMQFRGSLPTIA